MKKLKWGVGFLIFLGVIILGRMFIKTKNVIPTNNTVSVLSTAVFETSQSSTHPKKIEETTSKKEEISTVLVEKAVDEQVVSSVTKENIRSDEQEIQKTSQHIATESLRTQITTTQKVRLDPLGNSGKEFATYEEAYEWGHSQMAIRQMGYVVGPVMYSDGSVTYSVDFRK